MILLIALGKFYAQMVQSSTENAIWKKCIKKGSKGDNKRERKLQVDLCNGLMDLKVKRGNILNNPNKLI